METLGQGLREVCASVARHLAATAEKLCTWVRRGDLRLLRPLVSDAAILLKPAP